MKITVGRIASAIVVAIILTVLNYHFVVAYEYHQSVYLGNSKYIVTMGLSALEWAIFVGLYK